MKNYFFKGTAVLMVLAVFSMLAINSCKDDPEPEPIPVEDGLYIMGGGTALDSLAGDGLMTKAKNEVLQEVRSTLYEMYIAVEAGTEGFNLVNVVGGEDEMWGPGPDFAEVPAEELDVEEPQEGLWRGSYEMSETAFTVPEDGLYHVVVDTELGEVAIAKVEWGLIGGATPGGWTDDTPLTESAFDKEMITFSIDEVTIGKEAFKFRYSGGWKIYLDTVLVVGDEGETGVTVNSNFGGAVDALEAGGDNIQNDERAIYAFEMTWELGEGTSATMTYVKDAEPLAYPDELHLVGASIGGWDWAANGIQMIPVNSQPHLFWKIVWIEAGVADAGIKFSPIASWDDAFGVNAGSGSEGIYDFGGDNVPDVAESGYYNVVVNYVDETVEVNPALVYGIGQAFGGYDNWPIASAQFTEDTENKTMVSPPFTGAADADNGLRIHTAANTLTTDQGAPVEWWQAEFVVLDGKIEYRGAGGDQERVTTTIGDIVTLDFINETGTITTPVGK